MEGGKPSLIPLLHAPLPNGYAAATRLERVGKDGRGRGGRSIVRHRADTRKHHEFVRVVTEDRGRRGCLEV